jgi:glycosyltransferase involved in cell wall biosynthesis
VRLLLVSQYFSPDITAAAFRIAETADELARHGHRVFVVTSVPHRGRIAGPPALDAGDDRVTVVRTPVIPPGTGGALRHLACYASFVAGSFFLGVLLCLRKARPEVIWVSSPPLPAGLSGWGLAALFRRPFVLDIRDVWPESAVAAGQISGEGLAFRIGKRLESFLYERAAHITCVAAPMKRYIEGRTATAATVIYNGVTRALARLSDTGGPAASGEHAVKTITYAGNLGRVQELDLLVRAFAELRSENLLERWRVRLIGAGALAHELTNLVASLGVTECVAVEPPMSREDVIRTLHQADVLFLSLTSDPTFELTIPSKLFDCLLVGRPIVAGLRGEGRQILESTGANICYDPGDIEGLKSSLLEATTKHSDLTALASKNTTLVLDRYTREESVRLLSDVLAGVSRARGGARV